MGIWALLLKCQESRLLHCLAWGGGAKPARWTHSTRFTDLGFPPEMLIGFEPGSKKLIGFQIGHRFSVIITVGLVVEVQLEPAFYLGLVEKEW